MKDFLRELEIDHKFEHPLGSYVYDLVLTDKKIIVEFDGKYHVDRTQKSKDRVKADYARGLGYKVIRRTTKTNSVIPIETIRDLVK